MENANVRGMSGTSAGTQVSFSTFYSKGLKGTLTTTSYTNPFLNVNATGTVTTGAAVLVGDWFTTGGAWAPGDLHEVYCESVSGTTPSGDAVGSWISASRSWGLTGVCVVNLYFRKNSDAGSQIHLFALTITGA
jgi:hypothetical protein